MEYLEFKKEKLKGIVTSPRDTETMGVYDFYKLIRKNKWYNIGRPVTEHEFYTVIREVNRRLAKNLTEGEVVTLPHNMGRFELRKLERGARFVNGKLKVNYPIDWRATWMLWASDEQAYKDKIRLRFENKFLYYIKYCKNVARYENRSFFEFAINSRVKKALSKNINKRKVDTIW